MGFLPLLRIGGERNDCQSCQYASQPEGQVGVVAGLGHLIVDDGAAVIAAVGFAGVLAHVFIAHLVARRHVFDDVVIGHVSGISVGFIIADFVGGGDGALCGGTIGVECKDPFKPVTGLGVVDGDGTMWVPSQVPTRSALVIL